MTERRIEAEELDDASLDYLHAVRDSKGTGAPGVFIDEPAAGTALGSKPGVGALCGAFLLVTALVLLFACLWHDPLNLAMLLTGMTVLGGWLLLAWVRVKMASGRRTQVGYFKFLDPLQLWACTGSGVVVTPLKGLQEARCKHEYASHGTYESSNVRLVMEEGVIDVKLQNEVLADAMEAWVNELVSDREGLPLERGLAAAKRAKVEEAYDDEGDEPELEGIPEPHKARGSYGWLIKYALILVAFGLTFFLSYQICRTLRDWSLYSAAENGPPADLRVYLADKRNTAHRKEAVARLKVFHDNLATGVEARPGDASMKTGMANLIRVVHDSPTPVITIAFTKGDAKDGSTMEGVLGEAEAATMASGRIRQLAEKELTAHFKSVGPSINAVQIGDQIVAFGEATGEAFAMILIDVKLVKKDVPNTYAIVWKVRYQRSASDEDNAISVGWKQDVVTNDPRQLETTFRTSCEQFPTTFASYLKDQQIPPQNRP